MECTRTAWDGASGGRSQAPIFPFSALREGVCSRVSEASMRHAPVEWPTRALIWPIAIMVNFRAREDGPEGAA